MLPMIGYDVSYGRMAFRTKIDDEGISTRSLEVLLERAVKFVQEQSDGRWIISNKAIVMSSDRTKPVELTVIVPAGSDQYQQMLAAVKAFEDRVAVWLTDYPFDTTLRTIEDDGVKCEICGKKSTWARAIRILRFLDSAHFCNDHAKNQKDFHHSGSSDFFWRRLGPTNT